MVRVLIVDDSATAREAITAILQTEPRISIVGEAADGEQAVAMAAELKPDVITMDINMPQMDGHSATRAIMAKTPTPIVVVTSVTQEEMVHQGLDILLAGALDIVQKPSAISNAAFETVRSELVSKVLALSHIKFHSFVTES